MPARPTSLKPGPGINKDGALPHAGRRIPGPTGKGADQAMFAGPITAGSDGTDYSQLQAHHAQENLIRALMTTLAGAKTEEIDKAEEALKKTLETFFTKTKIGQKLTDRLKDAALSDRGLPLTLMLGSTALAAMIANKTDIPSTPDIDLSANLTAKLEVEGTWEKPQGIKLTLTLKFGQHDTPRSSSRKVTKSVISQRSRSAINTVPNDVLRKWILKQAFHEYEMAGPREEKEKKENYQFVRDNPSSLPEARLLGERLAIKFNAAVKNNSDQVDVELGTHRFWDRIEDKNGLVQILRSIVTVLTNASPDIKTTVRRVVFRYGPSKRPLPILIPK